MFGCAVAGVFAVFEFLYGTKHSAKDSGVTWAEEMKKEISFFMECVGNTREVCRKNGMK